MGSKQRPADSVFQRLVTEGLFLSYTCAAGYQARMCPGVAMVLSGEPLADLNYLTVDNGEQDTVEAFRGFVEYADGLDVPFAAMLMPAAVSGATSTCEQLGLAHATDWPVMVCDAAAVEDHPLPGVTVKRLESEEDHAGFTEVLASAFHMPPESVARAMPISLFDSASNDVYLAEYEGRVQSTVSVTRHGEITGIWAMGTLQEAMGKGIGKALLSRAMCTARDAGAKWFFLGATPSGYPLYVRLGYETAFEAQVWVRGETNQA
jgi:GNAT superfamily N-acetyltransferase